MEAMCGLGADLASVLSHAARHFRPFQKRARTRQDELCKAFYSSPRPPRALLPVSYSRHLSMRVGRKLLGRLLGVHGSAHRLPQGPHESRVPTSETESTSRARPLATLLRRRQIAVQRGVASTISASRHCLRRARRQRRPQLLVLPAQAAQSCPGAAGTTGGRRGVPPSLAALATGDAARCSNSS